MPSKTKKTGNVAGNPPIPPNAHVTQPNQAARPPAAGKASEMQSGSRSADGKQIDGTPVPVTQTSEDQAGQPAVNRKKQKRREKEAAKRIAEPQRLEQEARASYHSNHPHNTLQPSTSTKLPKRSHFQETTENYLHNYSQALADAEDAFYSGAESQLSDTEGLLDEDMGKSNRKKKKTGKKPSQPNNTSSQPVAHPKTPLTGNPSLSAAALRSAQQNFTKDEIWNTSTQAERENIKQFWLQLGEDDRRSLVKVEKEAVLRKMKEQQKHSCSCTVCGRKRTAIEEELEVLYDAYYEELEQFAHHNHGLSNGATIMSDPRAFARIKTRQQPMAGQFPIEATSHDPREESDDLDEEYEAEVEPYSSDDAGEGAPGPPPDFFTFGNSLTVKDGILTVADDLLKNDGKHFIDMMESLAEKRMQRERAICAPPTALTSQDAQQGHTHPPLDEDDEFDEDEEDDGYESPGDDEIDPDDMDAMTEDQRMEEGRRMFQIFAARMFEQRVLTAYRETVARERQHKLIEELEEENRLDSQRKAKQAREAAKKKEKKQKQKQVKDEEKAKKEAEKAVQEAATRQAEEKKQEEQRRRKDEQRKKREAERKAADEDRMRKEAEKQKKIQEDRDRQQEAERKHREAKEREKKKREDARKKERDERESKEREAREKKLREDQERKAREEQDKREKEAALKAEKEHRARLRQEEPVRRHLKRPIVAVPMPQQPLSTPTLVQSPHYPIVTPFIPAKAPTPVRARQHSRQELHSHGSSPQSAHATATDATLSSTPSTSSFTMPYSSVPANVAQKQQPQAPSLQHPQSSVPLSPIGAPSRSGQNPYPYSPMAGQPPPLNGGPAGLGMMPGMVPQMPMYPGAPTGGQYRGYGTSNGVPFPPGMNNPRHFPQGLGAPFQPSSNAGLTSSMPPLPPPPPNRRPSLGHVPARQQPLSHDRPIDVVTQPHPISRPGPIGQSLHSTPDYKENRKSSEPEIEQITQQLGSKALLEDSDLPLSPDTADHAPTPGAPGSGRFNHNNFKFNDPRYDMFQPANWASFQANNSGNKGPMNLPGMNMMPKPGTSWPPPVVHPANAFGMPGGGIHAPHRPHASRPVAIRLMLAETCRKLSATPGMSPDGFHPAPLLLRHLEQMKPAHEPLIPLDEMLEICDTEGNSQNGGGMFVVRKDAFHGKSVKFSPSGGIRNKRPAALGSPIIGQSQMATFGGIGQPLNGPH